MEIPNLHLSSPMESEPRREPPGPFETSGKDKLPDFSEQTARSYDKLSPKSVPSDPSARPTNASEEPAKDKHSDSFTEQIAASDEQLSPQRVTSALSARLVDTHTDSTLPEYLELLLEGSGVCGDSQIAFQKPPWYDDEKFKLGQKLSVDYSFGVVYAHMISLLMIFAFKSGLEPLMYTRKSDSPFKAFKRYLSTVIRVKSWSETDIWESGSEGNTNLKVVRGMHDLVRKSLESEPAEEIASRLSCEGNPRWIDHHGEITDGFKASCPIMGHRMDGPNHVYVSQTDMAVTQFGFVSLVLLFPKMFGIHHATDADFEGYVHFWRTISYLLGVEDRYNLCGGDLETVKRRCRDIIHFWVKPRLSVASLDWMHMSRCMCEGVRCYMPAGVSFELVLYYLCHVLQISSPKLRAILTFSQLMMYYVKKFLFVYAFRLVGVLHFQNFILELVIEKGQEMCRTPDTIRELETRVYPYVKG